MIRSAHPCARPHVRRDWRWEWETVDGVRTYTDRDGRRIYRARCSKCGVTYDVTAGGRVVRGDE